jgi:hypothetical protein
MVMIRFFCVALLVLGAAGALLGQDAARQRVLREAGIAVKQVERCARTNWWFGL